MQFKLRHFLIAACAMLVMAMGLQSAAAAASLEQAPAGAVEAPAHDDGLDPASDDLGAPQHEPASSEPALAPAETAALPDAGATRAWPPARLTQPPAGDRAAELDRPPRRG